MVPARHLRYAEVSAEVFAIFRRYTPLVEGLSVDEAFLDVTASRALFGEGEAIARRIKSEIRADLGLAASAGVAPCKFAAKIASDLDKPDGLVVVPEDVAAFLAPLPVERMWGVGPKTALRLREAGLATIGDLAAAARARSKRCWARQARRTRARWRSASIHARSTRRGPRSPSARRRPSIRTSRSDARSSCGSSTSRAASRGA